MSMKKINILLCIFAITIFVSESCQNSSMCDVVMESSVGYASKGGVLILNNGIESPSSLTYISPQGDVTPSVFEKENNKPLCYGATDMYRYNDNIYIVSQGDFYNPAELVVVGATDLKEKERYLLKDIHFKLPDGITNPEQEDYLFGPEKIYVLDRENILIHDNQAVFRLNLNSKPVSLNIIEGTYRISNHGAGIDTSISRNGGVVINNKLYLSAGGWVDATPTHHIGVYEFVKNKNEVNNQIGLITQGTLSGLSKINGTNSSIACIAYRGKKSYVASMDVNDMSQVGKMWKAKDVITANLLNSTPMFIYQNNIYYIRFRETEPIDIRKYNLETKNVDIVSSFSKDETRLTRLSMGITFDDKSNNRFFVSGTDNFIKSKTEKGYEFRPSLNIVLEYKLNKDGSVELHNKIENKTSFPVKFLYY